MTRLDICPYQYRGPTLHQERRKRKLWDQTYHSPSALLRKILQELRSGCLPFFGWPSCCSNRIGGKVLPLLRRIDSDVHAPTRHPFTHEVQCVECGPRVNDRVRAVEVQTVLPATVDVLLRGRQQVSPQKRGDPIPVRVRESFEGDALNEFGCVERGPAFFDGESKIEPCFAISGRGVYPSWRCDVLYCAGNDRTNKAGTGFGNSDQVVVTRGK